MALHLVTGGSGFVGQALVRELLKNGHSVRSLDLIHCAEKNSAVEYCQGSILDRELLRKYLEGVDTIHHAAAAVPLVGSSKIFEEVNVEGTKIVCQTAVEKRVKHFNYLSSSAIYGSAEADQRGFSEEIRPLPFEAYGKSKLKGEGVVITTLGSNLTYSILRPRTVIGPGRLGIFELLFHWVHNNKPIYILGNGENKIQLVHVEDLVRACIISSENRNLGTFNIGTDRFGTMKVLLQNLSLSAGSSSKIRPIPLGLAQAGLYVLEKARLSPFVSWHYRSFHKNFFFDTSKAQNELRWTPKYSNDEMLLEAYLWYIQNKLMKMELSSIHRRPLRMGLLSIFKK